MLVCRMVTCLLAAAAGVIGRRTRVLPLLTPNAVPPRGPAQLSARPLSSSTARIQPAETRVARLAARHDSWMTASASSRLNRRMEGLHAPRGAYFDSESRWNDLLDRLRAPRGADVDVPLAGRSFPRSVQKRFKRVTRRQGPAAKTGLIDQELPASPAATVGESVNDVEVMPAEVMDAFLDEWVSNETVQEIFDLFRGEDAAKDAMLIKLRSVYEMLIAMGLDVFQFVEFMTDVDEEGNPTVNDDGDYDEYSDEVVDEDEAAVDEEKKMHAQLSEKNSEDPVPSAVPGVDEDYEFLDKIPPELVDAWEKDDYVKDIINKQFHDDDTIGTESLKVRNVCKMMMYMGLDIHSFISFFAVPVDEDGNVIEHDYDYVEEDEDEGSSKEGADVVVERA